jgi:hypothetical protein
MPNWCNNSVTFTHEDPAEVMRLVKAFNEERLFNEFITCPPALHETVEIGEDYNERHEAKEAANREAHGFSSWYDWNVTHWGTKWDVGAEYAVEVDAANPNTIILDFDTAWSPPIEFYETMTEMGWSIKAFYYEPGMAFCGLYEDGSNDEYSLDGNADWVDAHIPKAINECFAIAESMEMWEEEEEENQEIDINKHGIDPEGEYDTEDKSGPDSGC